MKKTVIVFLSLLSICLISTSCAKKTKTCKCISGTTSITWDRQTSCSEMEEELEHLYGVDFRCSEWYNY